jgi:murein DD-endopeptidase MepM/ murein hydrolase activator NlpD
MNIWRIRKGENLEFRPLVNDGDRVTLHTMLGIVGNTGWSHDYHLHMEVWKFETRRSGSNWEFNAISWGGNSKSWIAWDSVDISNPTNRKDNLRNPLFYFGNQVTFKAQTEGSWDGDLSEKANIS